MITEPTEIGTLITRDPALRNGRPIIAGTGTCVRTIALDHKYGWSPEQIATERPHLKLAQIYAALAYYYSNQTEIDADIDAEQLAYDHAVSAAQQHSRP